MSLLCFCGLGVWFFFVIPRCPDCPGISCQTINKVRGMCFRMNKYFCYKSQNFYELLPENSQKRQHEGPFLFTLCLKKLHKSKGTEMDFLLFLGSFCVEDVLRNTWWVFVKQNSPQWKLINQRVFFQNFSCYTPFFDYGESLKIPYMYMELLMQNLDLYAFLKLRTPSK